MTAPTATAGFTLIETLVAMAVLAVAAAGLLHASTAHVDLIAGIEARTSGRWRAENALAEARLRLPATRAEVKVKARPNSDPDLADVTITAGGPAPVVLRGFVDTRAEPVGRP